MSPKHYIYIYLTGIILIFGMHASAWAKVGQATRYLEHSASLAGPTGWINIPSASVPDSGKFTAAIHRAEAKFNFGALDILEGGIYFHADRLGKQFEPYQNLSTWEQVEKNVPAFIQEAFRGQGKIKLLDQDWAGISLAGGIEEENMYVVVQRHIPGLSRVTLLAGWGTGRFEKGFGGFSKTVFSGAEIMFEFDGAGINFGLRMLLASHLILDLVVQDLSGMGEVQNLGEIISEHFLFGITYVEKLW